MLLALSGPYGAGSPLLSLVSLPSFCSKTSLLSIFMAQNLTLGPWPLQALQPLWSFVVLINALYLCFTQKIDYLNFLHDSSCQVSLALWSPFGGPFSLFWDLISFLRHYFIQKLCYFQFLWQGPFLIFRSPNKPFHGSVWSFEALIIFTNLCFSQKLNIFGNIVLARS